MATRSSRQTNKMRRLSLSPQSVLDFRSRCLRRHRRRCRRPRRTFLHADALQARREQARPSVGPDRRGIRARSGERRRRHRRRSTTQTALWRRGRRRERERQRERALCRKTSPSSRKRERTEVAPQSFNPTAEQQLCKASVYVCELHYNVTVKCVSQPS